MSHDTFKLKCLVAVLSFRDWFTFLKEIGFGGHTVECNKSLDGCRFVIQQTKSNDSKTVVDTIRLFVP